MNTEHVKNTRERCRDGEIKSKDKNSREGWRAKIRFQERDGEQR